MNFLLFFCHYFSYLDDARYQHDLCDERWYELWLQALVFRDGWAAFSDRFCHRFSCMLGVGAVLHHLINAFKALNIIAGLYNALSWRDAIFWQGRA